MTHDNIHTCSYECERPACIKAQRDELAQRLYELVAEAVAAEREACAAACEARKIIDPEYEYDRHYNQGAEHCAFAIRARGE